VLSGDIGNAPKGARSFVEIPCATRGLAKC
jgi:hypothetical protein